MMQQFALSEFGTLPCPSLNQLEVSSHYPFKDWVQIQNQTSVESMDNLSKGATIIDRIQEILEERNQKSSELAGDSSHSTSSVQKRPWNVGSAAHSWEGTPSSSPSYSQNHLSKRKKTSKHQDLAEIPKDGYHWRKYGQKQIKDSPNIRAYFACARKCQGCPAKKMVDRKLHEKFLRISYEGEHNHDAPVQICKSVPSTYFSTGWRKPSGEVNCPAQHSFRPCLENLKSGNLSDNLYPTNETRLLESQASYDNCLFTHPLVADGSIEEYPTVTETPSPVNEVTVTDSKASFYPPLDLMDIRNGLNPNTEALPTKNVDNWNSILDNVEDLDRTLDFLCDLKESDVESSLMEVLESVTREVEDILGQSAWQQLFDSQPCESSSSETLFQPCKTTLFQPSESPFQFAGYSLSESTHSS